MPKAKTFEENMAGLTEIVKKLEEGDAALEESLALFERGVALGAACQKALETAELRVTALVQKENGEMEEAPFEGEEQ
jgi:exodeoxyribonuclease VII small subunit